MILSGLPPLESPSYPPIDMIPSSQKITPQTTQDDDILADDISSEEEKKHFIEVLTLYSQISAIMFSVFNQIIMETKKNQTNNNLTVKEKKHLYSTVDNVVDNFVLKALIAINEAKKNGVYFIFLKTLIQEIKKWNDNDDNNIKFRLTFWTKVKIFCFYSLIVSWVFKYCINSFINNIINTIKIYLSNKENINTFTSNLLNNITRLITTFKNQERLELETQDSLDADDIKQQSEMISREKNAEMIPRGKNKNIEEPLETYFLTNTGSTNFTKRTELYQNFLSEIMKNFFTALQISSQIFSLANLSFWMPINVYGKLLKVISQIILLLILAIPIALVYLFERIINPIITERINSVVKQKSKKMISLLIKNLQIKIFAMLIKLLSRLQIAREFAFLLQEFKKTWIEQTFTPHYPKQPKYINDFFKSLQENCINSIQFFFYLEKIIKEINQEILTNKWQLFIERTSENSLKIFFQTLLVSSKESIEKYRLPQTSDSLPLTNQSEIKKLINAIYDLFMSISCSTKKDWDNSQKMDSFFNEQQWSPIYNQTITPVKSHLPVIIKAQLNTYLQSIIKELSNTEQLQSRLTLLFQTMHQSLISNNNNGNSPDDDEIKNLQYKEFNQKATETISLELCSTLLTQTAKKHIDGDDTEQSLGSYFMSPIKKITKILATTENNIDAIASLLMNYILHISQGLALTLDNNIFLEALVDRILTLYTDRDKLEGEE